MLVLSRRQGERIMIGCDVVMTIIRSGGTVRVGFEAPPSVKILRGEVLEQDLAAEKRQHPGGAPEAVAAED